MENIILNILNHETDNPIEESKKTLQIKIGKIIDTNIFNCNINLEQLKYFYKKINENNNKIKISDNIYSIYYQDNKCLYVDGNGGMKCMTPNYIHHDYYKSNNYDLKIIFEDYLNSPFIEFPCKMEYNYKTNISMRSVKINDKISFDIINNCNNPNLFTTTLNYTFLNKKIDHNENIKLLSNLVDQLKI